MNEINVEAEYVEFMRKHDRGCVNRDKLDHFPAVGEIVYNRYYGNGKVVEHRKDHQVVVEFEAGKRIFDPKYLMK